jgi:phosphate transport system substrate-binding protein
MNHHYRFACLLVGFAVGRTVSFAQPAPDTTRPSPATPAEIAAWRANGRTLPKPELLQPTLDAALPAYQTSPETKASGPLKGAASDVLAELTKRWMAAFQKLHPEVSIDLPAPYAGSLGAQELIAGGIDFVMVSRELRPADIAGFNKKFGYDPLSVPIMGGTYRHFGFLDSVAFFVHKDNPLSQLTFTQLDALLSTTRHRGGAAIRTWGELGLTGEWADKPVHVWGVKPWNGFEEFVRQRVLSTEGHRGEWRDDLNFVETVFPISPHIEEDRYALGYAGVAYIGPGVKKLDLSETGSGPFYAASYDEVARARYPLSRLVYINVNKRPDQPLNPALAEFIRFILSREGQRIILDQAIFLPFRAEQANKSLRLL